MPRSLFQDERGVSEVAASLIMILIVSLVGTILYAYSTTSFNSSESSFQLETILKKERARERLVITTIWWNVTNDHMNITILNYGKIEFVIDAIYIDGTPVSISAYQEGRGETIAKGELVSIKFTSPITIEDDHTYEIIAVTNRGSRDVEHWKS
jgi:archaellum component FlaF (FlaF/FlaG flagellin family)